MASEDFKTSELDPGLTFELTDELPAIRPIGGGVYTDVRITGAEIRAMIGLNPPVGALAQYVDTVVTNTPSLTVSGLAGYKYVEIELSDIVPQTDNTDAYMLVSVDGGATFLNTLEYAYLLDRSDSSGAATSGSTGAAHIVLATGLGNGTGEMLATTIKLPGHDTVGGYRAVIANGTQYDQVPGQRKADVRGIVKTTAVITDVRVLMSSGNINAHVKMNGIV